MNKTLLKRKSATHEGCPGSTCKQAPARRHDPRRAGARAGGADSRKDARAWDKGRIGRWSHEHRADKKYRTAQAEGSRRYLEQLYRDAEFGRVVRSMLDEFGDLFKKLAEVRDGFDTRKGGA